MQKALLISSLLVTTLLSDNSLGEKISVGSVQEAPIQEKAIGRSSYSSNPQAYRNYQPQPSQNQALNTRVSPSNVRNAFKSDHHRYNKRYSNFNYDTEGYYNDDGYYFGYYNNSGYFFNNIFFAYNRNYTYNDRRYRRGFFRHGHHHHRRYIYHTFNDWNRVHCYREPNIIVRGHYYDRAYYPRSHYRSNNYQSHYDRRADQYNRPYHNNRDAYRTPSRMNVTRMNNHDSTRHNPNNNNYRNNNNFRDNNHRNNNSYRSNTRRSDTRMRTRNSSQGHKSSRHMGMSR